MIILIGLAAGATVELLLPGHTAGELFLAMMLGVAGALLSRYIGERTDWWEVEAPESYVAAACGSIAILLLYGVFFRRGSRSSRR